MQVEHPHPKARRGASRGSRGPHKVAAAILRGEARELAFAAFARLDVEDGAAELGNGGTIS